MIKDYTRKKSLPPRVVNAEELEVVFKGGDQLMVLKEEVQRSVIVQKREDGYRIVMPDDSIIGELSYDQLSERVFIPISKRVLLYSEGRTTPIK